MITNEEHLAIVLEQIGRLDRILESYRQKSTPATEHMYRLFSEGPQDMRDEMQADVDAYLATKTAPASEVAPTTATDPVPVSPST
jgi:hypothetical protein